MKRIVALTSGGLDSTLMTRILSEKYEIYPLFINYGQLNAKSELAACKKCLSKIATQQLKILDIKNFGQEFPSGITCSNLDIVHNAFLPCRNLLFLVFAASYAVQINAKLISIGLLTPKDSIFPDQQIDFVQSTQKTINLALNSKIKILTPLITFSKKEVVDLSNYYNIASTYSCHKGTTPPCGNCIACNEFNFGGCKNGRKRP